MLLYLRQVQIGHNVAVGSACFIAAQTGIAGNCMCMCMFVCIFLSVLVCMCVCVYVHAL